MQQPSPTSRLFTRVAWRIRVISFARRFYRCVLTLSVVYGLLLLVSRMTGVFPSLFSLANLWTVPVAALAFSLLWRRPTTVVDAAKQIDRRQGTKDLFLTCAMIDNTAGGFQSLVTTHAERQTPNVSPVDVVPYHWLSRASQITALALTLVTASVFLPQLDPFGQVASAQQAERDREQLEKDRKSTQLRLAQVRRQQENEQDQMAIERAIEDLKTSFRAMKRDAPRQNLVKLLDHQKDVGARWRKLGLEKLQTLLAKSGSRQDFAGERDEKLQRWTRELQEGSDKALTNELSELREDLADLARTTDPVEREQKTRQLKKRLRDLEEFVSERTGSPELSAALKRAMRQLEMSRESGISQEAMKALAESLDLAQVELKEIAQAAKDMKKLEEALQALQLAKQVNDQEMLDGEACAECQSLSDYAELYAQMIGDEREGQGLGNQGFGRGGEAPEDDSVATEYQAKHSKSAVTAGKVLLSMQSRGLSDSGEAKSNIAN